MKRLPMIVAACFLLSMPAFAQPAMPVKNGAELYKLEYPNLSFGNSTYTLKVLELWKAFDENRLDETVDMFTDNVMVTLADGTTIKGKANLLQGIKEYRNGFSKMESTVVAVTTLKSPAHPEHEVTLIWAEEKGTAKDGSSHSAILHEVWFFNQEGKITSFHQYAATPPKE